MANTVHEVVRLINAELSRIADVARRAELAALLTRPAPVGLDWEYGPPGDRIDAWVVGRALDGSAALLYCDRGFGPTYPWGCIRSDSASAGADADWAVGLEDAAIHAGLLAAPHGYQVP